jgi:polyhydroxybutyrate depolymerase
MSFPRASLRQRAILSLLILMVACTPESRATPSSDANPQVMPILTVEATLESTLEAAPTESTAGECARGAAFETLDSGSQARRYLLHVPSTYDPETPTALVLVFHGAGIGAERFVDYTRFSSVADREGFLVVYPEGLGERPVWDPSPGSRDVQFASDLIDTLQIRCNIDHRRIYATGHSNGGGMVHRLACELAERIAAIGPVSGAYQPSASCAPSRPVPVFAIHGTADPIVPYEGIPEWASAWAERNGCDPEPVDVPHNVLIGEKQWGNCKAGADVILYTIVDLGHEWPGDLIDVGQTLWDFFEQHPLNKASL